MLKSMHHSESFANILANAISMNENVLKASGCISCYLSPFPALINWSENSQIDNSDMDVDNINSSILRLSYLA
jgi:hypothetical protein